jgi:hypothetical protein
MGSAKTVGVAMLGRCQKALENKISKKINELTEDMDHEAIERLAWNVLGQEGLFNRRVELQKELEEIDEKFSAFNGGNCGRSNYNRRGYNKSSWNSQLDDAKAAAQETLYPEIARLQALRDSIEERTVFCLLTEDLQEVVDIINKEI